MAQRPFVMLGIESSCDETAAAIVVDDKTILANEIASQVQAHAKHGGVVPEVAARAHLEVIDQVISDALAKAKLKMGDIDGVAATAGPGLIGGVAVGTAAQAAVLRHLNEVQRAVQAARHVGYVHIESELAILELEHLVSGSIFE